MKALAIAYLIFAPLIFLAAVVAPSDSDAMLCLGGLMLLVLGEGWIMALLIVARK